jgi:hypothetical protein
MPPNKSRNKDHILLPFKPESHVYKKSPGRGDIKFLELIQGKDKVHGEKLLKDLVEINEQIKEEQSKYNDEEEKANFGSKLVFKGFPNLKVLLDVFDKKSFELVNTRKEGETVFFTVYIPHGKISYFIKRVQEYINSQKEIKPKHFKLVNTISEIQIAAMRYFWSGTEKFDELPKNEERWWEVWTRGGSGKDERDKIKEAFEEYAGKKSIKIKKDEILIFPERVVYLVYCTLDTLYSSPFILDCLAEIKSPQKSPSFFMNMDGPIQKEWCDRLKQRVIFKKTDAPMVCILDSGVNNGHPLLEESLLDSAKYSYNGRGGTEDVRDHGTLMAGSALFGDLFPLLISDQHINIFHRLESVRILNENDHEPQSYGSVTEQGVYRPEIDSPIQRRIFCMAVTTGNGDELGEPTSWSAAVDKIAFGDDPDLQNKRLFIISAGNIENMQDYRRYPDVNDESSICDPAQSWNAVTAGGFTEKRIIDKESSNFKPIAPLGLLSPSSRTSLLWDHKKWPVKPDIVFEAGNYAIDSSGFVNNEDSLHLLTTQLKDGKYFHLMSDTSAATAEASRFCAQIWSKYPDYWPETVRALVIHSASWNSQMLNSLGINSRFINAQASDKDRLLSRYGYGVPNINSALNCGNDQATIIIQDYLKPFKKEGNKKVETDEMMLHELPWPKPLRDYINCKVKLRITLSYFIDSNPTKLNTSGNYGYASFGLRFDLKKPNESPEAFIKRISNGHTEGVDDDEASEGSGGQLKNWQLGAKRRNKGSIHSDLWEGPLTELVDMNSVIIYPVTGWWKTREKLERYNNKARYSLIITLEVDDPEIDIYTPILNEIKSKAGITVN